MSGIEKWWPAIVWAPAVLLIVRAVPQYLNSHRWLDGYVLMYLAVAGSPFVLFYTTPLGRLLPWPLVAVGWAVALILATFTFRACIVRSRSEHGIGGDAAARGSQAAMLGADARWDALLSDPRTPSALDELWQEAQEDVQAGRAQELTGDSFDA